MSSVTKKTYRRRRTAVALVVVLLLGVAVGVTVLTQRPDEGGGIEPVEVFVDASPIEVPELKLFISANTFYARAGDTYKLSAQIYDVTNRPLEGEVRFKSGDESVAAVAEDGVVTAKKEGECTVVAYIADYPFYNMELHVKVGAAKFYGAYTYLEGMLVANKQYHLPSTFAPGVDAESWDAFNKMKAAAANEGVTLWIVSGYRSYSYQSVLFAQYAARDGEEKASTYSARAGTSEHQTGMAFDLNYISNSFGKTAEGKWLAANSYKYGFILRYPEGKQHITGYKYEPWHFRYIGEDNATKVFESGLTLEEYLGIDWTQK